MMQTYNISLNKELAEMVEKQVKAGRFANRSEFFRQLLREVFFMNNSEKEDDDWIYQEPYISELNKRVDALKSGKEEFISLDELDKELNL
jgi:Arc/MetJ-type ribon-helix-helix transcriptional regulator